MAIIRGLIIGILIILVACFSVCEYGDWKRRKEWKNN